MIPAGSSAMICSVSAQKPAREQGEVLTPVELRRILSPARGGGEGFTQSLILCSSLISLNELQRSGAMIQ